MSDHLNLNRLIYFSAVVETGSFTAAADRLKVAKAVVSHQVAKLEEELGTSLLSRTTRRVVPTEEGRLFHERSAFILKEAESAWGEISGRNLEPSGTLTLTAPLDYGTAVVARAIADYLKAYPHMHVEAIFDDGMNDLIAEGIDLSIRVGWLEDSSHQTRRLGTFDQILVATPQLASRIAKNITPAEAVSLPWIANRALKNPSRWVFSNQRHEAVSIETTPVMTADKTPAAYACMLAGAGVSVFPNYMVEGDIRTGQVVRLMPDWALPQGGIHAVLPAARFRPAKVSVFLEMLVAAERRRKTTA